MTLPRREIETMTREIRTAGSLWHFTLPGEARVTGRGLRRENGTSVLAWAYLTRDVERFGGPGERVLVIELGPFEDEPVRGPWAAVDTDPSTHEPPVHLSELRRESSHLVGVLETGAAS